MPAHPFGLADQPFAAGHDRRFLCPNRKRDDALAMLRQGIREGAPFIMVTGDPGIGKTSVVWEALSAAELRAKVGVVQHASLGHVELLAAICLQFGIAVSDPPVRNEMMARLEQRLCELRARGRSGVLVVDDAHGATGEQLEEIRTLSEMKAEGRELLQIVLVGLPELERRLGRPDHTALRERIEIHCRVAPLGADQTEHYLHHRVAVAGGIGTAIFPSETCREIHSYTYGFPRDINTLAGRALDRAQRENAPRVLPEHVHAAMTAARLRGETTAPRPAADVPTFPPAAEDTPVLAPASAAAAPEPPSAAAPPVAPDRRAAVAAPGAAHSGRRSLFRDPEGGYHPPRPATENVLQVALAAVVVIGIMVFVLVIMRTWDRPSADAPQTTTATPDRAGGIPASPAVEPRSRTGPGPAPIPVARRSQSKPNPAAPAAGQDSRPPKAQRSFGLEVASFLDRERAAREAARIAVTTGRPCRVVADRSTDAFTVVLGSFRNRSAAERAAGDLVSRKVVHQARVVVLAAETP